MHKHHHRVVSGGCSYDSSSSDDMYIQIPRPRHARRGSTVSSHHHHHVYEPSVTPAPPPPPPPPQPHVYGASPYTAPLYAGPAYPALNLAVPVVEVGGRKRASSTSGHPQPIIINNDRSSRSHSRERNRPRSHSRGRRYYEEDDFEQTIETRGRVSRTPSPYYRMDYDTRKALERLKKLEDEKEAEAAEKKFKADAELKRAKDELKKAQEEERDKAATKKAIEDWQRAEDLKKLKAKKEQEELDKKVEEQLTAKLVASGYTIAEIQKMLKGGEDDKSHHNEMILARERPTYIKIHTKYLLPETLEAYNLPWTYDRDTEYILIKEYINDELQERLFAHTKKIRSRRLIEAPIEKQTILKVNDKKKDKMYLVRKKDSSPFRFGVLT